MPLSDCNATIVNYNEQRNLLGFQNGIDESQYCAYDPIENNDSCQGDSGGPLQTFRSFSNPPKVVAIVSFGVSCGTKLPGIYTRVANYVEWIGHHVWPNGDIQTARKYISDDDRYDDEEYIFSAK